MQIILHVQQNQPDITRTELEETDQWLETRLRNLTDSFGVGVQRLTLGQVYQGVFN